MNTTEIWVAHTKEQDEQARRRELKVPYKQRVMQDASLPVWRDSHRTVNSRDLGNGAFMKLDLLPDEYGN